MRDSAGQPGLAELREAMRMHKGGKGGAGIQAMVLSANHDAFAHRDDSGSSGSSSGSWTDHSSLVQPSFCRFVDPHARPDRGR